MQSKLWLSVATISQLRKIFVPKIFNATDVDHSTTAQTAELKHGKRKKLLVPPRLRQRWQSTA
ncbi:hypothetical protein [Loigolactobacillus rennini]|uniref:hypothetical protein n=1 Tax=Loigolactobacillus rennini TaxID=238013 RepID=UPI0012EE9CE8|nr:hypothetical protein [Loigolactobacillus rennini]